MATNKLIDLSRLSRFWDKAKNYIDDKLAPKAFYPVTAKSAISSSSGVELRFTSNIIYDIPVKSLFITIPSSVTGYTSVRFIFNNGEYTIYLGEILHSGGSLDVISGILTRDDQTTKQLSGINLKASYGENIIYVYDLNDVMVVYYEPYDNHIAAQYYSKTEINRKFDNDVYHLKTEGDNRNVATVPNNYTSDFIFKGLKTNTVINSPSADTFSYLFGLRGWQDSTGGRSYEIAFNNSGIFVRNESATTLNTWDSWRKIPYDNLVQPRIQRSSTQKNFTSSTSLAYTGKSISCPANHAYIVKAIAFYNNSQPVEFYVGTSSTVCHYYTRIAGGNTAAGATFIMLGGETYYYWAKYAGSSSNNIVETVIDIPY